ncbi:MAG: 16S rRNA (guanine(966)-N(2))-methyltransferase RsmD [Solirubrobacteraceae bacterium]
MRVIAGSFGGRRLSAPRGGGTRPTSDRVREAIFSMLVSLRGGRLAGARVLDLFAGSGALGIEALSRGAQAAVFVERDVAALAALRRNLDGLSLPPAVAEVRCHDALTSLTLSAGAGERFELVLLDPPYADAERLAGPLAEGVPAVLAADGLVVVESATRAPLRLQLPLLRQRRYGETTVAIHLSPPASQSLSG